MNFPGTNWKQINSTDYCIFYPLGENTTASIYWIPDKDYQLLGYCIWDKVAAAQIVSCVFGYGNAALSTFGNLIYIADINNAVAGVEYNFYTDWIRHLILTKSSNLQLVFSVPAGCQLSISLYIRELPENENYLEKPKCGFLEWIKGECVHGDY